jgi:ABC-type Na+ transport system ATPase subunit NatA
MIGIIHGGSLRAEGTLAQLLEKTGESDLEECFVRIVAPGDQK